MSHVSKLWRAKFKAFSVHFLLTVLVTAACAALVFLWWFPAPFNAMLGGTTLFALIVVCDLALGPLMSLVIYNPAKSRQALWGDYAVVIVLQLAALLYGLHVVQQARPLFLVFAVDRYVVVSTGELPSSELEKIPNPELKPHFLSRYRPVYVEKVTDASANFDLTLTALDGGRDLQHVTENYRPISAHTADILREAKPLDALPPLSPGQTDALQGALQQSGQPAASLRWLAVQFQTADGTRFWTVLVDTSDAQPRAWLDLDPL